MKYNPSVRFYPGSLLTPLMLAAATLVVSSSAFAANKTWVSGDANNTWDTTATTNWLDGIAWNNATPDSATFGGTGETVTLGTAITADDLTFSVTGYTIAGGGNTLTLTGTPVITVSTGTATIDSVINGSSGLTKLGAGELILNGANTYTGLTTVL